MGLTRRTARFGELAESIDARVQSAGVDVAPAIVDAALNDRLDHAASAMGISARTALRYAPEDLPDTVARSIVLASKSPADTMRHRHLRVVR